MEIDVVDIDAKVLEVARVAFLPGGLAEDQDDRRRRPLVRARRGRRGVRLHRARRVHDRRADSVSPGDAGVHRAVPREARRRRRVRDEHQQRAAWARSRRFFTRCTRRSTAAFPENAQAFALGRAYGQPDALDERHPGGDQQRRAGRPRRVGRVGGASTSPRRTSVGRRWQRMVHDLVVTLPDLGDAPVFTDDYAPIETMPF